MARQPLGPESQKLVIRTEFTLAGNLASGRSARRRRSNRTGRNVYYAMTEICKVRRPNFEPARPAVDAVRHEKYLAARRQPAETSQGALKGRRAPGKARAPCHPRRVQRRGGLGASGPASAA